MDNIIQTYNQVCEIDKHLELKYLYVTSELKFLEKILESTTNCHKQIIKNLK